MTKPNITEMFDEIERKFQIVQSVTSIEGRRSSYLSTGLLGYDLMLGGGILPGGWYTNYGGEGAGKSTALSHMLYSAHNAGCTGAYWDFEGSVSVEYLSSIISQAGGSRITPDDIFGLRDAKGKWAKTPVFRLYTESIGDQFFNSMASLARHLPDLEYLDGRWWYAYENTKANKEVVGAVYNKEMFRKYNRYYIEAENGLPQIILFVDSYPMMYPSRLDEDDAGSGMAAVARMFSENIPKIAGKLRKKGITVVGVNQLRERPGFSMGDPSYEPCGKSIQFVSSVRVRQTGRSVPFASGPVWEEDSVGGSGVDSYRYVHMKATKNKAGLSLQQTWQRLWINDANGEAHGFDPVWDTLDYMRTTGQCDGTEKNKPTKLHINVKDLKGSSSILELPKFKLEDLKLLVLSSGDDFRHACKELGFSKEQYQLLNKYGGLRGYCFQQIKSGVALDMRAQTLRGDAEEDEEEEDEDD